MENDKNSLRKSILHSRDMLLPEEVKLKSKRIFEKLADLKEYKESSIIMCYMDFRNEVMTADFIQESFNRNKRIAVPLVVRNRNGQRELLASEIHDLKNDLAQGTFGIREPVKDRIREIQPQELDLVIVPGVVFDIRKNRIGYGAGFYDRFLTRTKADCLKAGVAFDMQVLNEVPVDVHDVPLDIIVTESRIIR